MKVASLLGMIGESRRTNLSPEMNVASVSIVTAARDSGIAVLAALGREGMEFSSACDAMAIFVPDGDELVCVYSTGPRATYFVGTRVSRMESPLALARAARGGYRVDAQDRTSMLIPGDRSGLALPMCDERGRLHGVAYWSSTCEKISDGDILADLVALASVAYVLACERESDRTHATFDALTGLYAPRAFRSLLSQTISEDPHTTEPMSLLFIDTDHFKDVNDRFGHAVGDSVLGEIATLLKNIIKPVGDFAARNGGDEFCALLRYTHKSQAFFRAEDLCGSVRAQEFFGGLRLTLSIGVATFPDDAHTASELLETADAAMYFSKRNGRDCVSFRNAPGCFERVQGTL